jgi:hypothetical protein
MWAISVEGGDVVRQCFPLATMAFVLGAVLQEIAMELAQHVCRERNLAGMGEHLFHDKGVACDFLFIASGERFRLQTAQQ